MSADHATGTPIRLQMLRSVLAVDAILLGALGLLLIGLPERVEEVFGFPGLPSVVGYLIGLWGCALLSLAIGSAVAVRDPVRHIGWVQAGIARGVLECAFGFMALSHHLVTWPQARFGIVVAAAVTVAFLALYPFSRQPSAAPF